MDNGAAASAIDWANFFVSNIAFMAPVPAGFSKSISAQANMSLKRRARPPVDTELGNMEMLLVAQLARSGERFFLDLRTAEQK